ncbi:DUF4231 domain-containing protein [Silvibacterium dinghuense]|uniref:DUF4231 domain-containing protein n=2 Tax=Silvibacterium dinghuense TaxID=1560006 RepID=A0A4Q1SL13_9BACT|nr:DUF4231 domain-containing protein [Silvibacterium dinghuense]
MPASLQADFPVAHPPASDPILNRLEDQIGWYDRKSRSAQRVFKRIKVVEILAAALIPFLTGLRLPEVAMIAGGLGVLITILEGILHLNQYQQNWTMYRATCEALKHEKYTFLALAGPYATAPNPRCLLAERIESTVSQEHAQWSSFQQQGNQRAPQKPGAESA